MRKKDDTHLLDNDGSEIEFVRNIHHSYNILTTTKKGKFEWSTRSCENDPDTKLVMTYNRVVETILFDRM